MPEIPLAVGIDLGTTFSVLATLDPAGKPQSILNGEGDRITPSAIFFDEGDIVVGREALKSLATNASEVALCPKRELGARHFPKRLAGEEIPPEVLEAFILRKMQQDAIRQIGAFSKVVITVPAYFDEVRRKATQDAGFIAGLDVIDIINEPTAAAIAFGRQEGFINPQGVAPNPQNILVYDLGGGTFDVTVMRLQRDEFTALATDGDVHLGGRDWDQRLVDYIAEEFIRSVGYDPREDPNTEGRLWRECEEAKRTLSARQKAVIRCDIQGKLAQLEITRTQFQEMTNDLLERTAFTTRQTLEAAGLTWPQIDRVLLVGGSTRMPAVVDMLRDLSGRQPDASLSPDEAVAHGAAIHASVVLTKHAGAPPAFKVKNVCSHSLGVVAIDRDSGRSRNAIVIPRNTGLPVNAKRVFRTNRDDQRSILAQIIEGESMDPEDCCQLGKCVVRDLPRSLPAGTPIEVTFRYESNGRLTVRVSIGDSKTSDQLEITRENSLSDLERDAWRKRVCRSP